ncbi:MAG TPA: ArgE/DapE family deacylase [Anaerolineales bacterium]|nr:ArgE/DapE family deacylase [Anaerolineales bacterium]
MSDVIELLSSLVSIDSTNPDLVPGGAGEAQIAAFIANWLERAGLEVKLIGSEEGRPNVVGIARGSGGGKALLLNGHMDTVAAGEMVEPHRPRIEDNRMYGRGAYDMKGGLAACMVAAAEAAKLPLRGDVIVTAVADEEYASLGTAEVAKQVRADGAIVAEFTELQMILAHKGFVWLEVETVGRAAHGSRPDLGVDAIAHMGRVLAEVEAWGEALRAGPAHPLLGSGSVHASLIRGGREISSYPERCTLSIERRTLPGETAQSVEAEMAELVRQLRDADPSFKAIVRRGLYRQPLETPEDADIAQAVQRAAVRVLGQAAPIAGVAFWTDAALLAAAGIPSLLFGPAGAGAHAAEEWVDLQSVEACAQVYLEAAREFCG